MLGVGCVPAAAARLGLASSGCLVEFGSESLRSPLYINRSFIVAYSSFRLHALLEPG